MSIKAGIYNIIYLLPLGVKKIADNINVASKTIATDEVTIGGTSVHVQRTKIGHGADGTYTADANVASPLPVNAFLNASLMQDGTTQLTPKFKYVNITASADIVPLETGKKIRVLAIHVDEEDQTADVILTVEDASGGADLAQFAGMDLEAKELSFSPVGWFETTAGNALYGTVAGTTPNLNICVVYVWV